MSYELNDGEQQLVARILSSAAEVCAMREEDQPAARVLFNKLCGIVRSPDDIMADFTKAVHGEDDIDPFDVLVEIINDVLDTVQMAGASDAILAEAYDYVSHYYTDED